MTVNVKAFSVNDIKARAFLLPFFLKYPEEAIRAFSDMIAKDDPPHPFYLHPEDYTLFQIGEFDEVCGILHPLAIPKNLGNGVTFVNDSNQAPQNVPQSISNEPQLRNNAES